MAVPLLRKIDFGNEAGDDVDPKELAKFFVEQGGFKKLTHAKERISLILAKKGVGKSALINWLGEHLKYFDSDAVVLKLRGSDLTRDNFRLTTVPTSPNERIKDWQVRLCSSVNRELAKRIKWAAADDTITLVESAEIAGFRSRNFVSAFADRFTRFLDKLGPEKQSIRNEVEILKRVTNRRVWILIDDLDATFQKKPDEIVELSTFFSACRYLCQDIADLNIRTTMRTDVWPILRRSDEALDKMDQYTAEISWSDYDFRTMLARRIQWQIEAKGLPVAQPKFSLSDTQKDEYWINQVFAETVQWGDRDQKTHKVIYTISYTRPRWGIQLAKLAQRAAENSQTAVIGKEQIDEVWGDYGRKRIHDLIVEHRHQCAQVEELLNSFRGSPKRMTRDQLFDWIKKHITNLMTPVIEGVATKEPLPIASFLYRTGFIMARKDEADGKGYDHFLFHEMPDFLSGQANRDQGVSWEIHPCYREALDIQSASKTIRRKKGYF